MRRTSIVAGLALALAATPSVWAQTTLMSLDVNQAVKLALQNNPGFRQAQANVSLASANRNSALVGLLPSVSGSYGYSDRNSTDTRPGQPVDFTRNVDTGEIETVYQSADFSLESGSNTNSFGFTVNEDLSLAQLFSWRGSQAVLRAQEHSRESAAQGLVFNVRNQFYLTLRAEALLEVQKEDYDLAQNERRRTQTMFDLGSVAKADVLKAQVRVTEAEVALIRQRNAVEVAHSVLATYLGLEATTRFDLQGNLEITPVDFDSTQVLEDVQHRPDLLSAAANVNAASHELTASMVSRVPALFASYSRSTATGNSEFETLTDNLVDPGPPPRFVRFPARFPGDIDTDSWSFQFGARVTIDAFLNISHDQASRARLRLAEEQESATRLVAQQEVEQAMLDIRASISAIASAEQGVTASEEDVRLSRERYEQGLGTFLDLLQAQVALTRARSTLVDAKTALKISEANLERARGVPVDY